MTPHSRGRFFRALAKWNLFPYPRRAATNYADMRLKDKLWWAYKYYIRPVERAEKGSGLEAHFASASAQPAIPDGFAIEHLYTLSAGGDILPSPFLNAENLAHLWDDAEDFFFAADVVCANLESPVTSDQAHAPTVVTSLPAMNNAPDMLPVYRVAPDGISLVSTANNHCLDKGSGGLTETLNFLDQAGILHVGTARSAAERDAFPVLERNGIRTAFLSYTFSTNGREIPPDRSYCVNLVRFDKPNCDCSLIERQIQQAREDRGADIVVLLIHWGWEFESYPAGITREVAQRLAALGADAIIGNHPHTIQPVEILSAPDPATGAKKPCFVAYALGDLVDENGMSGNWSLTNLVRLTFAKGSLNGAPHAQVTRVELLPLYVRSVWNGQTVSEHRLLQLLPLAEKIRRGENPNNISKQEQTEILRLDALAKRLLANDAFAYQSSR